MLVFTPIMPIGIIGILIWLPVYFLIWLVFLRERRETITIRMAKPLPGPGVAGVKRYEH